MSELPDLWVDPKEIAAARAEGQVWAVQAHNCEVVNQDARYVPAASIATLERELEQARAKDELIEAFKRAAPLCETHGPRNDDGARSGCPYCAIERLHMALSRIDYIIGEPNEMGISGFDCFYDEQAVVANVERKLAERTQERGEAHRIAQTLDQHRYEAIARAESAEQQVEKMREVLRAADEYLADEPAETEGGSSYVFELRARIRAALAQQEAS